MENSKLLKIVLAVACFLAAAATGYQIFRGNYETMDIVLLVMFLAAGFMYVVRLTRGV
jgi:hypothetical protein